MQTLSTLKQQNQELLFTLSQFSHEIRNPLTLISSELQLMADRHPEVTSFEDYNNILENLEYMKELLNELSTYNNAGKLSLVSTNPALFLRTVLASVRPTLEYMNITLIEQIPDSLPLLPLDQMKMRQVLLNLLRNAWESMSAPGGRILVTASAVPSGIHLVIQDNGCGIPLEDQKDIFRPFVTHKTGGTGLGLAIVRQVIEAHGGSIQVHSLPGQGTSFHIFLG